MRRGRHDRDLRRSAGLDGPQEVTSQRAPAAASCRVSTFEEVTKTTPEKSLTEPLKKNGRPEQQRPDHDAPPGRRPQAPLPRDRLQAHEGRRAGEGRRDRVRPEPVGPDRAAPLRRRREGLHPRSGAAAGRRDGRVRARTPTSSPGNALPLENIPTGTMVHNVELKPGPGRQDGPLGRLRASSSSRRTTATACSGSRRARCAACR